ISAWLRFNARAPRVDKWNRRCAGLGSGRTSPAQGDKGMSHSPRSDSRPAAHRRHRKVRLDPLVSLEDRMLPAPVVAATIPVATLTPTVPPTNTNLGTVAITRAPNPASAAPITSVAQLTSANSFGGDVVRIKAGPGGVFGSAVYAISRGAGDNASDTF